MDTDEHGWMHEDRLEWDCNGQIRVHPCLSVVPSPVSRATASPCVLVNRFQVFQSYVKTCHATDEFWWGTVCRPLGFQ
jgi:hypothetical protein